MDINALINRINEEQISFKGSRLIIILISIVLFFLTFYFMIIPAKTESSSNIYKFYLKDTYLEDEYSWKKDNGYKTEYELNLYFEDTSGNSIKGFDVTLEIGPDAYEDVPYGFGVVPMEGENVRGSNLIEFIKKEEYVLSTGEKYLFERALVYTDGAWREFSLENSNYWHIWCQNSSSKVSTTNYGWRGNYNESTRYIIDENTEFKFIYKLVRFGEDKTISSLDKDSGIKFKLFNYNGDNSKTGVNANGLYDYFTFRGIGNAEDKFINTNLDADGFGENRAKVLPNLDSNGYPVFDCREECGNDTNLVNTSLGYLFGSSTNALGQNTGGVISYSPINTILKKENIDGVEYYYYDSNKNAVDYDIENNRFMLRNYLERGYTLTTYSNESSRYEFLPFNYLSSFDTKTNNTNNLLYNYDASEIDYWFGMTMEFDFYMPSNGLINGKDMIFEFSGDDDVWVFIDDVLVLDLGGTHGAVDGSINFKTGEVVSYLNWNGTVGNKNITNIYEMYSKALSDDLVKWNSDKSTYANYTKHTLKFFYLERGAAVTNCKIKFNIPVLPQGSLSVGKEFIGIDKYNEDYQFRLYDVTDDKVGANLEYTIDGKVFKTDENGMFSLKNTEVAVFKLTSNHSYYVEEINSGENAIPYSCTLDEKTCPSVSKTANFLINPESSYQAIFTNKYKTYDLNLTKKVEDIASDDSFDFRVSLEGENTSRELLLKDIDNDIKYSFDSNDNIIFNLKNNESITIYNIPIDSNVKIEEIKHDGYNVMYKEDDIHLSSNDNYEFIMNDNKNIVVYNIPGIILPETGGIGSIYYKYIGIFLISLSLIISKIYKLKGG